MSNAREMRRLSLATLSTEIGFLLPCLTQMPRCEDVRVSRGAVRSRKWCIVMRSLKIVAMQKGGVRQHEQRTRKAPPPPAQRL